MLARHRKTLGLSLALLAVVWLAAWGGFRWAQSSKLTAAKVRDWAATTDFRRLQGDARRRALEELARRINQLPLEERRRLRMERMWGGWFEEMTEDEKGWFIEATLPTGFKQMMASFEQLPEARRQQAVEDGVRRLREARRAMEQDGELEVVDAGTNAPPEMSRELQEKAVKLGLKAYYGESSARTKAELAPLLEEIQRSMEGGRLFRRGRMHE